MKKLLKVAALYERRLEKMAAYPDLEAVKNLVKKTVENLKDTYEDDLEGVLYASHVQVQHHMDDSYVHFILNVDRDEKDTLGTKQPKRQTIIQNGVLNALNSYFKTVVWRLKFNEAFAEDPGWFGKKYE